MTTLCKFVQKINTGEVLGLLQTTKFIFCTLLCYWGINLGVSCKKGHIPSRHSVNSPFYHRLDKLMTHNCVGICKH